MPGHHEASLFAFQNTARRRHRGKTTAGSSVQLVQADLAVAERAAQRLRRIGLAQLTSRRLHVLRHRFAQDHPQQAFRDQVEIGVPPLAGGLVHQPPEIGHYRRGMLLDEQSQFRWIVLGHLCAHERERKAATNRRGKNATVFANTAFAA